MAIDGINAQIIAALGCGRSNRLLVITLIHKLRGRKVRIIAVVQIVGVVMQASRRTTNERFTSRTYARSIVDTQVVCCVIQISIVEALLVPQPLLHAK